MNARNNSKNRVKSRERVRDTVILSMLGAIMFCSKIFMEFLPNIHLVGVLTITYTIVFRIKALIPIYINVLLVGVYGGFNLWWIPYLYIWTLLWALVMLIPKKMPKAVKHVVYPLVAALHGLAYGTLYAPAQALMFGLDFDGMVAWIIAGIPFDIIHASGNLVLGLLIVPLSTVIERLYKRG